MPLVAHDFGQIERNTSPCTVVYEFLLVTEHHIPHFHTVFFQVHWAVVLYHRERKISVIAISTIPEINKIAVSLVAAKEVGYTFRIVPHFQIGYVGEQFLVYEHVQQALLVCVSYRIRLGLLEKLDRLQTYLSVIKLVYGNETISQ